MMPVSKTIELLSNLITYGKEGAFIMPGFNWKHILRKFQEDLDWKERTKAFFTAEKGKQNLATWTKYLRIFCKLKSNDLLELET